MENWQLEYFLSLWKANKTFRVASEALKRAELFIKDHPIEAEWVHIVVPVLIHELLVEMLVKLVVLFFKAAHS